MLACSTLLLGFVASEAVAGKRQLPQLWPEGATLLVTYAPNYPGGPYSYVGAAWTPALVADHYRVTVLAKVRKETYTKVDESPFYGTVESDGRIWYWFRGNVGSTYVIIVTAYSGPDETTAYAESLSGKITVR